ncbi:ribonuclease M5 [Bacillus tianshenii]|nr:ribonuclease M5 [Bacillus tianshenii]
MEGKMKIKEIIVVEGKDDTVAIRRAVNADTIETNGSAINDATLERIRVAQETRGVIVLTDPDYPGERIRKIISQNVPGCKHAFIPKGQAISKKGRGLGVEHASPSAIQQALEGIREEMVEPEEEISWQELVQAGLIGGSQAKERRRMLGDLLKIGYTNGKQFHKRLTMFQISRSQFEQALDKVLQEE